MKLHIFPPSPNARKCLVTADMAGVAVETVIVDLPAGDHKKPDFLALNPNGKMPVLEFGDGTTLWESNAICNRICAEVDTPLWPKTNQRYDIMRWQFWEMAHWAPATTKFIGEKLFGWTIDRTAETENLHRFAKVLDDHLAKQEWLSGEGLTTADISVAATLALRHLGEVPLDGFTNIESWMQRLEAMPAWARANPVPEPA